MQCQTLGPRAIRPYDVWMNSGVRGGRLSRALGVLEAHLAASYIVAAIGAVVLFVTDNGMWSDWAFVVFATVGGLLAAPILSFVIFPQLLLGDGSNRVVWAAAAAVYTAIFCTTLRLRWRRWTVRPLNSMLCESCGYNLTGNESGVCPECGTSTGVAPLGDRR